VRVAHFIQRYPPALGGSEAYFARLGRFLAAQGDEVTVFTSTAFHLHAFWSPRGKCLPAGVQTEGDITVRRYGLWRCPGRRYLLKFLSLMPHRTWQCLAMPCNPICRGMWHDAGNLDQRFDVVHASAFPYAWPIVCARRLAHRLRIPFFLTPFLHLGDPANPHDRTRRAYTSTALSSLLRSADGVFVQTESERQAVLGLSVPAGKIVLQGLGVDSAECTGGDRRAARRRWGAGDEEIVIGHLANNSREKGSIDLLQAAERLWRAGRSFLLVLAGAEMPNFQRFWRHFAMRERVTRLGPLSDDAKRDFFAGIDVFALPSRSDSFGLVLLEAWANGVPNVAYRAGGIADVIRHEEDGLLALCGDVDRLATALGRLIHNGSLRQKLGRAGKNRATAMPWRDKLQIVRDAYETCRVGRGTRPTALCNGAGSRSSTHPTE
jgi:glycosyltransferase involved in cell wall biosynthesis